ncbi:MAG: EF-hand domain-containing protein [Kofleriaceae bacterium]|jgi:hypothetical protein|nr:EF-hand domain-containing protein [Kofleriaceae bacterium]MBP9202787.1 EF-hand domain-containing protein [Kofleriaceae bacterium]
MSRHADSLEALPAHESEVEAAPRPGAAMDGTVLAANESAEEEIKGKLRALLARYGGDIQNVFKAYDRDGDGAIDGGELTSMLKEAGIGSGLTRGMYASAIISRGDKDGDGKIQWDELQSLVGGKKLA